MKEKTPEDVAALKARWLADPYWVLENTAGFEAYRAELRQFRIAFHEQLERNRAIPRPSTRPMPAESDPQ